MSHMKELGIAFENWLEEYGPHYYVMDEFKCRMAFVAGATHAHDPSPMQKLHDMNDGMEKAVKTYMSECDEHDAAQEYPPSHWSAFDVEESFKSGWQQSWNYTVGTFHPPTYQKPVMAEETAKDGILAAAQELMADDGLEFAHVNGVRNIIAKHCVGNEFVVTAGCMDVANRQTLAIEKSRADNLQAELVEAEQHEVELLAKLAKMIRACEFYKESRDSLIKKLTGE